MITRPTTIKHTNRQRVTSRDGVELERQSIYMPAEHWAMLQKMSYAQGRSGSLVLQNLIQLAALGTQKDKDHDITSSK